MEMKWIMPPASLAMFTSRTMTIYLWRTKESWEFERTVAPLVTGRCLLWAKAAVRAVRY